jgi:uracil-DNA glycosylase
LLGYSISPCEINPTYSADYFKNQQNEHRPSEEIDEQLQWLEQELAIVNKQVVNEVNKVSTRIRE